MSLKSISFALLIISFLFSCQSKPVEVSRLPMTKYEEIPLTEEEMLEPKISVGALEQSLLDAGLVNVQEVIPGIFVELKYSTTDNFFRQDVYGELTRCYLQPLVAEMLKKSHEKLKAEYPNLTFLVYDGVRPLSVQQILWDNLDKPDSLKPLYVADPKIGGLHNYGVAVDLTLADQETGEALDLGTEYDFFGYPAYPDREAQMLKEGKITQAHIANREILRKAMAYGGFTGIGSEWWHFNAFSRKEAGERFELVQ